MDNELIISTERLILRRFVSEDAENMFLLNADPEVVRYTGELPFPSVNEARELIQHYPHYEKRGFGRWTVIERQSQKYLGWCGLNYNEQSGDTDLGFRFMKDEWGKGYATEAGKVSIAVGFERWGLKKIIGRAMVENAASRKVLLKVGMLFESEFEAHGSKCYQYCIIKK